MAARPPLVPTAHISPVSSKRSAVIASFACNQMYLAFRPVSARYCQSMVCLSSAAGGCSTKISGDRDCVHPTAGKSSSESNAHTAWKPPISLTKFCSGCSGGIPVELTKGHTHNKIVKGCFTRYNLIMLLSGADAEALNYVLVTHRTNSCRCIKSAGQPLLPDVKTL